MNQGRNVMFKAHSHEIEFRAAPRFIKITFNPIAVPICIYQATLSRSAYFLILRNINLQCMRLLQHDIRGLSQDLRNDIVKCECNSQFP